MLRLGDFDNMLEKIIITVGVYMYISALEPCREMKFGPYLYLTLIIKFY